MTTEEKAKAYDKVSKEVKDFFEGRKKMYSDVNQTLEYLFSELKESEEERIRKELISFLQLPHPQFVGERKQEKWIAWLEKQGQVKNSDISHHENKTCKENDDSLTEDEKIRKELIKHLKDGAEGYMPAGNAENYTRWLSWVEKQGEQKLIFDGFLTATNFDKMFQNYKVHKFKVGDYIKHNKTNIICKVISVNNGSYYVENIETSGRIELFNAEQNFHLWTINDAEDGDVLAGRYGTFIFMGESDGYCGVLSDNTFIMSTRNNEWTECLHPVTKEQHDLLFQKMKEAGYEWDSANKQLIRLEKQGEQKWIEEDDANVHCCIAKAERDIANGYVGRSKELIDWLKSLKQRMEQ